VHGISRRDDGSYNIIVGDNELICKDLSVCITHITNGLKELKTKSFEMWQALGHFSSTISVSTNMTQPPKSSVNNILFLHSVKEAILLGQRFPELKNIVEEIKKLLHVDIIRISPESIFEFNNLYLQIHSYHFLIMRELFRVDLIKKMLNSPQKMAIVQGPGSCLDVPWEERVSLWSKDANEIEGNGSNQWDEGGHANDYPSDQKKKRRQWRYRAIPDYVFDDRRNYPYSYGDTNEVNYPHSWQSSIP